MQIIEGGIRKTISKLIAKENGPLVVNSLLDRSECPMMSIALIKLNGINRKVCNQGSQVRYYILVGEGHFILWREDGTHYLRKVSSGAYVEIPRSTPYQDIGRMVMISINHPAYNPDEVKELI